VWKWREKSIGLFVVVQRADVIQTDRHSERMMVAAHDNSIKLCTGLDEMTGCVPT